MSPFCLYFTSTTDFKHSSITGTLVRGVLGVCYVGCPLSMVRVRFQVHFYTLELTIVVQSFGYFCMSNRHVVRRSSGFSLRATLTGFNALQVVCW